MIKNRPGGTKFEMRCFSSDASWLGPTLSSILGALLDSFLFVALLQLNDNPDQWESRHFAESRRKTLLPAILYPSSHLFRHHRTFFATAISSWNHPQNSYLEKYTQIVIKNREKGEETKMICLIYTFPKIHQVKHLSYKGGKWCSSCARKKPLSWCSLFTVDPCWVRLSL